MQSPLVSARRGKLFLPWKVSKHSHRSVAFVVDCGTHLRAKHPFSHGVYKCTSCSKTKIRYSESLHQFLSCFYLLLIFFSTHSFLPRILTRAATHFFALTFHLQQIPFCLQVLNQLLHLRVVTGRPMHK